MHSRYPLHAWPGADEARRPTCVDKSGHTRPRAFGPEQERRPQTCMPHPPALLLLPPQVHIAYYPTPARWPPLTQALHASAQWPASRRPQRRCLSRAELRLSLLVAGRAWSCRAPHHAARSADSIAAEHSTPRLQLPDRGVRECRGRVRGVRGGEAAVGGARPPVGRACTLLARMSL